MDGCSTILFLFCCPRGCGVKHYGFFYDFLHIFHTIFHLAALFTIQSIIWLMKVSNRNKPCPDFLNDTERSNCGPGTITSLDSIFYTFDLWETDRSGVFLFFFTFPLNNLLRMCSVVHCQNQTVRNSKRHLWLLAHVACYWGSFIRRLTFFGSEAVLTKRIWTLRRTCKIQLLSTLLL